MKKVLILVKNDFINDRRVCNTALFLKKIDYDVRIIAIRSYRKEKYPQIAGLDVRRISLFSSIYSKKHRLKIVKPETKKQDKLVQKIKQNKIRHYLIAKLNSLFYEFGCLISAISHQPEIVWANDLNTLRIGYTISKLFHAKLIYDSHEIFLEGISYKSMSKPLQRSMGRIEKTIINKVNAVISTTDLRAQYLRKKYMLETVWTVRNCHKFTNVIDEDLFRKEYKISSVSTIFLYQGLIHEKRGIFNLVSAIEKIEKAVLIFMGDGNSKQELQNYIIQKNLEKKVFIKDAVPMQSLLKYTASADVGIQLILNTGFNHYSTISNKVFEYIMAEIPIIASDFPELRKIIMDHDIGLVINPDSLDEITNAITTIVKDKENIRLYKRNLKKMKQIHTWENEEKTIAQVLNEISK